MIILSLKNKKNGAVSAIPVSHVQILGGRIIINEDVNRSLVMNKDAKWEATEELWPSGGLTKAPWDEVTLS